MVRGSGVNIQRFDFSPLPQETRFLFVGRLVKGKGIIEYLDAARLVKRKIPDAKFDVVGAFDSNPTSIRLEQLQPYIDDGTIAYQGEQKDVRPFLKKCSCFVLPSYYGEGTPKSGLEAMATGRPIIVADAVGSREVVLDGVNGYLVSPKNAHDLAEKMISIAVNRSKALSMAEASRRLAEEVFDVRSVNLVICRTMGISRER
ncbi:glycosyltransferase [Adlercreutzia sp. ZJ242]|uniref:glycosyltransferase n=1 Tax=Adlercreutzia sp. ZJ242 TaxID=2709409 RepID=UPI00351BCA16